MPVAGASRKSKHLVVECAASLVPEILARSELDPVQIASQFPRMQWAIDDLYEPILKVHQIVDRESSIAARSGQQFHECAVLVVVRIIISAASKPAAAQPGRAGNMKQLVTTLYGSGAGTLVLFSPLAVLQQSPAYEVE